MTTQIVYLESSQQKMLKTSIAFVWFVQLISNTHHSIVLDESFYLICMSRVRIVFFNSSIDIKLYMVYSKPKTKSTKIKQQNNNNKFKIINRDL